MAGRTNVQTALTPNAAKAELRTWPVFFLREEVPILGLWLLDVGLLEVWQMVFAEKGFQMILSWADLRLGCLILDSSLGAKAGHKQAWYIERSFNSVFAVCVCMSLVRSGKCLLVSVNSEPSNIGTHTHTVIFESHCFVLLLAVGLQRWVNVKVPSLCIAGRLRFVGVFKKLRLVQGTGLEQLPTRCES